MDHTRDADKNVVVFARRRLPHPHRRVETPKHSILEEDDGRLCVRWLPCVSGDFKVIVTVNGTHIQGSPFKAGALNGKISPQHTKVLDMPAEVNAGIPAIFTIEARDQVGTSRVIRRWPR